MEQIDLLLHQVGTERETLISANENKPLFPFSDVGRLLAYLLATNTISYEQYLQLSNDYRDRNKYLHLFEMAPRTFGETWGEQHILTLFPQFTKETKEHNPSFDGEYDLVINNIRIEVKACRANNTKTKTSLASRAFTHSEASASGFKYHFQQLKPSCCDVFIWIGVCKDELIYWVLTSDELLQTGKLGSQHRNENTGVAGVAVYEGQVFMTEEDLSQFEVPEHDVLNAVLRKS